MAPSALLAGGLLLLLVAAAAPCAARELQASGNAVPDPTDLVDGLPGLGEKLGFGLHAGYVTVDEDHGRALFYIFAESTGNAAADPLVLWLNGGPGCSSIGGGFMSELGPFLPKADGTLTRNIYAWNQAASVIFLDSPAFVGFSYSNTSADAVVGDVRTAADSRQFLLGFLQKFPRYADRPLYITGESYAGHYVPNLAKAILDGNANANDPQINLQGIMVGNPWTDATIDNLGAAMMWWSHALISSSTFHHLVTDCNMSNVGPIRDVPDALSADLIAAGGSAVGGSEEACDDAMDKAMGEMGPINIYQVYADVCTPAGTASLARHLNKASLRHKAPAFAAAALLRASSRPLPATRPLQLRQGQGADYADEDEDGSGFHHQDACVDNEVQAYLNRDDVQAALHVHNRPLPWSDCTDAVEYSEKDLLSSMIPVYRALLATKLRIMVYSGDVDGIVPTTGTRAWVEGLKLKVKASWRPWLTPASARLPQQVGGYVTEYAGLTLATVRGAGHMVPYTQPARALQLFQRFLGAKPVAEEGGAAVAAA